jgi:hypothetical protein
MPLLKGYAKVAMDPETDVNIYFNQITREFGFRVRDQVAVPVTKHEFKRLLLMMKDVDWMDGQYPSFEEDEYQVEQEE